MSALVKVFSSAVGAPKYGQYEWHPAAQYRPTRDLMGIEIVGGEFSSDKGESIEETVKAGQGFTIHIGYIAPTNFHILYSPSSSLIERCKYLTVSPIGIPGEPFRLDIRGVALRQFDIAELDHIARLFMLD